MLRRGLLWLPILSLTLGGCATKSDIDSVREEIGALRIVQDSLARRMSALRDSVIQGMSAQRDLTIQTRGDLQRQMEDIERQLVQIQELLGQSQQTLRGLRENIGERPSSVPPTAAADTTSPDTATSPETGAPGGGGDARQLYNAAMEQFRRGAYNTARSGFQEFLTQYPADSLAPNAQLYLAETFSETNDSERALTEYSRVVQLYPNSDAAPTALYKAGLAQLNRGNKDSACEYFQRVQAGYPRSDEARLARDQSQRLSCR